MNNTISNYQPASLRECKSGWYITYCQWHPEKKEKIRFRERYNLNRIKDEKLRRKKALGIVNEINKKLPYGWPYEELKVKYEILSVNEAMKLALKIKSKTTSIATKNSYNSTIGLFLNYIKKNKWDVMQIKSFDKRKAMIFLDYCLEERKISATTYNNYVNKMKAAFFELLERGHIEVNPFSNVKKKREMGKKRRAFSNSERAVVIKRIKATNQYLFLAVALQYYCFIRPNELCKLKRHMFDLDNSLIRLPGEITKNRQTEMVTIPDSAIKIVRPIIKDMPLNYFIFGASLKPNPETKCSKNYLGNLHRDILRELWLSGDLARIDGLHWYSWKDTGATFLTRKNVPLTEIMRQMRHQDLSHTQRYCQSLYVLNKHIKKIKNEI